MQLLIIVKDEESGLNRIEYPDGDVLNCNGKKQVAIDYTIEYGVEYIFKIISNNGNVTEKRIYEEKTGTFLYNCGDQCEELTGGWIATKDTSPYISANTEDYDYMELKS